MARGRPGNMSPRSHLTGARSPRVEEGQEAVRGIVFPKTRRKRWKSGPLRSPIAALVMHSYCPACRSRSLAPPGPVTADGACDTRAIHAAITARGAAALSGTLPDQWRSCPPPAPKNGQPGKNRQQESPAQLSTPWPGDLEARDRLSPTKSGRNPHARLQAHQRARHVPRLRKAGCRASDQGRNPEPLHRSRNAAHAACRTGLSRERESPAFRGFAQQSRASRVILVCRATYS